jgi:LacI family transcriptional regulator
MCGNDVLAAGAISKARELGLNIPNDVSVTGFDDIELARYVFPALTTVHVPHRSMGRIAAQNLVDLIEHRTENFSHQLDVSIVMRDTLRRI